MTYEELITEYQEKIAIKEKPLTDHDGLWLDGKIAIRKDIPTLKEKHCVLAEELGHYHTTVGDITNLNNYNNYKQELRARRWGYNRIVGLLGLIRAFEHGCRSLYEVAEYLNVTEVYLKEALQWYRSKYGIYTKVDNYIIYFEPSLTIGKIF